MSSKKLVINLASFPYRGKLMGVIHLGVINGFDIRLINKPKITKPLQGMRASEVIVDEWHESIINNQPCIHLKPARRHGLTSFIDQWLADRYVAVMEYFRTVPPKPAITKPDPVIYIKADALEDEQDNTFTEPLACQRFGVPIANQCRMPITLPIDSGRAAFYASFFPDRLSWREGYDPQKELARFVAIDYGCGEDKTGYSWVECNDQGEVVKVKAAAEQKDDVLVAALEVLKDGD